MFNFLREVPVNDLVSGVHNAIRLINYRDTRNFNNGKADPQTIVSRIADEIQYIENVPIKDLDEIKASKYVDKLTDLVLRRVKNELGVSRKSGNKLLEKLRKQEVDKVVTFEEGGDKESVVSQLAVPIWENQELIGMLNIESQKKFLFEDKHITQQFVSQLAEIFQSAQKKNIFHRSRGMRFLTPLFFNIFMDALHRIPTGNFFVLTQPISNGLEIRIYGVEYKNFDAEPFLSNLSQSFIHIDKIENQITSSNLFTKPILHHLVGASFKEVDIIDNVEVDESQTDVVIRLEAIDGSSE